MKYAMYLRKSRADMEAEAHGEGETLARHERRLTELAQRMKISVDCIYREIVSGDTIAARPVMQKLLSEVETGMWSGVLVVEVERLARGDTIDQGIVAQAFKYSGTKIITPNKIYDPSNEFDEEYFEFGLFMSRREYKAINRRLQAGRQASVREGKWLGGPAPFGYTPYKLPNEKGSSLKPNEDAAVVRAVFEIFTSEPGTGTVRLCNRLNDLGYRSPTGRPFHVQMAKDILKNPVYAGFVTYGRRSAEKVVVNGVMTVKCPRHKTFDAYKGRHEPIVPLEMWEAAQRKLAARSFTPLRKDKELKNPLSGLLICEKCGHKMQMRQNRGHPQIFCHMYCGMVSSSLDEVENVLLSALSKWLAEYSASAKNNDSLAEETSSLNAALGALQKDLQAAAAKIDRAYDLVESGIYTPEMFAERQPRLLSERKRIEQSIRDVETRIDELREQEEARKNLIPAVSHIISVYHQLKTAQEKNDLLKTVLSSIKYSKSTTATSKTGSDLKLTVYPVINSKP